MAPWAQLFLDRRPPPARIDLRRVPKSDRGRDQAVLQAFLSGEPQASVAERLGVSRQRVNQILRRVLPERRNCACGANLSWAGGNAEKCKGCQKREAIESRKAARPKVPEGPCRCGCGRPAQRLDGLSYACRERERYNDPTDHRKEAVRRAHQRWNLKGKAMVCKNVPRRERIRQMLREGLTVRQIAEREGISWQVTNYYVVFHNLREES